MTLLNYRKILLSAVMIAFVSSLVFAGTRAFFSDVETASGNTFTAGEIDLTVDSVAHYNGLVCFEDEWVPESAVVWDEDDEQLEDDNDGTPLQDEIDDFNTNNEDHYPQAGTACGGTWTLTDLGPEHTFFDYGDLKPGDSGENTISLHLETNDGYVCAIIDNLVDNDNGLTEPEEEDGDSTGGAGDGELSEEIHFFAWSDDGNNIWESGEEMLFSNESGPASDVIDGVAYPLFTPSTAALQAGKTAYIGLYWCYGDITVNNGNNTLSCSGASATNVTQTDSMSADISFYVEQSRNNESFECPDPQEVDPDNDGGEVVGANLTAYQTPETCDSTVDDDGGADHITIQAAIDAASSGDTICVADGDYAEFTVDKDVTIAGLTNPNTGSAKITPSGPGVTELALVTSSDVTITGLHFDGAGTAFTGSQTAGVQISPSGSNIDNVQIIYNIIENLDATGASASNKGIQWWTASGSGFSLTNSLFAHNEISNIHSDNRGGYGVQTVGDMDNVTIAYNTVSDITGAWGAGVALDSLDAVTTSGVSVDHNHMMSGVHDGVSIFAVQVEANVDGGGIAVNTNNIESLLYGGSSLTPSPDTLDAEHNWWGTATPTLGTDLFIAPLTNVIDADPARLSAYPTN